MQQSQVFPTCLSFSATHVSKEQATSTIKHTLPSFSSTTISGYDDDDDEDDDGDDDDDDDDDYYYYYYNYP